MCEDESIRLRVSKLFSVCISFQKLIKDFMSWRVKTDKQIAEISNSLASTQVYRPNLFETCCIGMIIT